MMGRAEDGRDDRDREEEQGAKREREAGPSYIRDDMRPSACCRRRRSSWRPCSSDANTDEKPPRFLRYMVERAFSTRVMTAIVERQLPEKEEQWSGEKRTTIQDGDEVLVRQLEADVRHEQVRARAEPAGALVRDRCGRGAAVGRKALEPETDER